MTDEREIFPEWLDADDLLLLQVAGLQRAAAYGESIPLTVVRSLPGCIMQIYSREGLKGLYKGASLSIVKAAPASAITLTVYEFLAIRLIEMLKRSEMVDEM